MELKYNGVTLPSNIVIALIETAKDLNVPPSYLIVKLHYEGVWGTSSVARADNNWSGMSTKEFSGVQTRPSGVKVTLGSKRPAHEGGYYYRYATLADFMLDWTYLIRRGGIYKVADSATFADAVKGMFVYGGAKYDYATMDMPDGESRQRYLKYLSDMQARRAAINNYNDKVLDNIDKGVGIEMTKGTAEAFIAEAQKMVGVAHGSAAYNQMVKDYNDNLNWAIMNGGLSPKPRNVKLSTVQASGMYDWCAAFISVMAKRAGAIGTIGYEMAAERLGRHQHESRGTWIGRTRPKAGDLLLIRWDGKSGWADHIGMVERVVGDTIHTVEGNVGSPRAVRRRTYGWNDVRIMGYARPKFRESESTGTSTSVKLTIAEVANEVLADKWGKGAERVNRLTSAGYDAKAVQDEVNRIMAGAVVQKKSNDEIAKEILKGEWGNNPSRSKKLIEKGYDVNAIQKIVNQLLNQAPGTEEVEIVTEVPVDTERLNLKKNEFEIDGRVYQVIAK